jgi:hypothetical protein
VSEDGLGSAQSGYIGGGQQSWLQTTVNLSQPMQLGYWWLVSSQPPDGLAFSVDGVLWLTNAGVPVSWQLVQTNLTAGNHLLQWTYSKQTYDLPTGLPFADSGWVDEVTFSPVPQIAQRLAPLLSIALTGPDSVVLSWPASSTGFVLQQCDALGTSNWQAVAATPQLVNDHSQVEVPPTNGASFYRLFHP